ncbi:extensin-2-like, partial [Ceratina calcarata]|uniref:Extensin-2-like n=1 Tax=Ceratina calcarata TaxID=156304 RepID=A0AAJ7WBA5_9HYME
KLQLLFLAPSVILVQGYEKSNDPNDEPFLPIYPIYPYSPKLIKRGIESAPQLSTELYTPKVDAKDSYSASFNYPRDPYYPNYSTYSKAASPSSYGYYGSVPYSYSTPAAPYNGYSAYSAPYNVPSPSSYSPIPYSATYPNYYYQPAYYYPGYYNKPPYSSLPPPPPPPPPPGSDYHGESYSDSEGSKGKERNSNGDKKYRDDNGSQFVDGGNYISGNPRDLDVQPSTYKTSSPRNQLEETGNVKNLQLPLPKTTYRVISVAGQPVGPDYPLPVPYQKAQQLDELMSHAWAKLLVQNLQQVALNAASKANEGQYVEQNDQGKEARFASVGNGAAKGLTFIVNPNLLGKLNGQQTATTQLKKYPIPVKAGVYAVKPEKGQDESNEYETYENPPPQGSQDYDGQSDKQQQSYENEQNYQNQNFVTAQTPQAYSYQYTNYNAPQISQQQAQQYKNNLDDVNFSTDTKKG